MIFGLAAGISPGPLLALVLTEVVRHGEKQGWLVACAPLITDLPIVLFSFLVLNQVKDSNQILGWISFMGAAYALYLGIESFLYKPKPDWEKKAPDSLRKGVLANFLSPHPYFFWLSIGGPTFLKAREASVTGAGAFVLGFYLLLVGSKGALASGAARSKSILSGGAYGTILKILGGLMFLFALIFVWEGLKRLGLLSV